MSKCLTLSDKLMEYEENLRNQSILVRTYVVAVHNDGYEKHKDLKKEVMDNYERILSDSVLLSTGLAPLGNA